jgi:serine/threonine-protein phosphatase 2A regulatory subunit B'
MLESMRPDDILSKVHFCETIFDFTRLNKSSSLVSEAKNKKREYLLTFISDFDTQPLIKQVLLQNLPSLFKMISTNLFRSFKPQVTAQDYSALGVERIDSKSDAEEVIMLEVQWPHLQIVYELLLAVCIAKEVDCGQLLEIMTG